MTTLAGIPSSYRPKLSLYRPFNIIAVMRTLGDSVGLLIITVGDNKELER